MANYRGTNLAQLLNDSLQQVTAALRHAIAIESQTPEESHMTFCRTLSEKSKEGRMPSAQTPVEKLVELSCTTWPYSLQGALRTTLVHVTAEKSHASDSLHTWGHCRVTEIDLPVSRRSSASLSVDECLVERGCVPR